MSSLSMSNLQAGIKSRSVGVKLIIVCGLALLMTIPALFVGGLIEDRTERAADVMKEISGHVGGQRRGREAGPQGDVCYIEPAELEAAVQSVRAELIQQRARFVAAVRVALEKNRTRAHHPTIARTVTAVLQKLKLDAGV